MPAVDPPHVWHQVIVAADYAPGFDGMVNDYFLVRAVHFEPHGEFTDGQLSADELLAGFRWWQLSEITNFTGPDLFSPRYLATLLTDLLTSDVPSAPVPLGL